MNSVQLLGNLARDPEIRFTKTGKAVAMFTVACTRTYIPAGSAEQRELTDFIPCVAWGNLGQRQACIRRRPYLRSLVRRCRRPETLSHGSRCRFCSTADGLRFVPEYGGSCK